MLSVLLNMDEAVDPKVMLDPQIRNWVLLPIFIVMFLQGILRNYLQQLLKNTPVINLEKVQQTNLLQRSQRLRQNMDYLPRAAVNMRRTFFVQKAFFVKKKEDKKGDEPEMPQLPQQDPTAMMGMMKQNMGMVVPNMLLMGWVSYFFTGFVMGKLPFGLTDSFRSMLQRGINIQSLDVSYVSALSWYFLLAFGLRGLFGLVLGANDIGDPSRMMKAQQQMAMGPMGGAGGAPDPTAKYETEKNELQITPHKFRIAQAERRVLRAL